jgi:chromosome partitioning protein
MIITIGAEKGGVAKTRLATHIAALAAGDGVDVVLLDTDKQGSAISWAKIREQENVLPRIQTLPLPPSPAREVANLAEKYALVVVDIGAQNYRTMLECALISDLVLVPCGADQQEIESTLNVFDALRGIGPQHRSGSGKVPAAVVLTRVSQLEKAKATADIRALFAAEDISVFKGHIAQRSSWLATGRTGRAVHELKGKERSQKAVDEMRAVYDEILERAQAAEVAE